MFSPNQPAPENKFTVEFLEERHPDFVDHYNRFVKPHIDEFEQKRQEALAAFRYRSTIGVIMKSIVVIGSVLLFFYAKDIHIGGIIFTAIFLWSLVSIWCSQPVKQYKHSVHQAIFPNIFSFFGQDYKYQDNPWGGVARFDASKLIPKYDSDLSDNHITGTYDGVSLELMTSNLTRKSDGVGFYNGSMSDGGGSYATIGQSYTVFEGLLVNLRMNKDFTSTTLVERNHGGVFEFLDNCASSLERVHLEDPVFEKEFAVRSNNQVEARYLLTPTFMERLIKLSALFSNKIKCSFYNKNSLLIMIPTNKKFFAVSSIFVKDNFIEDIDIILQQMHQIFSIIEVLKLGQKTGI